MRLKILLATTVSWAGPARLVGGFGVLGCAVDAVCPLSHPLTSSRYLGTAYRYNALSPLRSVESAIRRSEPDIVVACDDRAVGLLVSLGQRSADLAPLIATSLGNPAAFETLLSRSRFIEAADALGVRTPTNRAVRSVAELESSLPGVGLPMVLKRDGSWGGTGVRIARSRESAIQIFRDWTANENLATSLWQAARYRDLHFLSASTRESATTKISVQQFIPGRPSTTSFAAWQGRLLACIHADIVETERDLGPSCVIEWLDDAEMTDFADRIVARFGLSGLGGIDYVRDENGRVHVLEINPRATVTGHLALGEGHDLLAALVGAACGEPVSARAKPSENRVVALFPQELARDPASRHLETAYHDVPADDPRVRRRLRRSAEWSHWRRNLRQKVAGWTALRAEPAVVSDIASPAPSRPREAGPSIAP